MVRVKRGFVARRRRKNGLPRAKGFRITVRTQFRRAKQAVYQAMRHATRHRRRRKSDMRRLFITRINAAARLLGLNYSQLVNGLKKANIKIDRKILADLAVSDAATFSKIAEKAKQK